MGATAALGGLAAALLLLLPPAASAGGCAWRLELRPLREAAAPPLAVLPLCGSQPGFVLSYRHSVSLTPVTETVRVTGEGGLELVETRFVAHGAGLPSQLDEVDAVAWREEGGEFILTLRRSLPQPLAMQVSAATENRLAAEGRVLDLAAWGDRALALSVESAQD